MKYARLKKNTDIQRLFKKGKKAYSRELTAVYSPSAELRMAVIVSKKHGKAVKRNRIKRLVRQAFYNTNGLCPAGCALILIPRVEEEYTLSGFEAALRACYKKMQCSRA